MSNNMSGVMELQRHALNLLSGYREKMHHIQDHRPSIKCTYRGRGCILIEVRTHAYYHFPIGNKDLFSTQSLHISLYLLNLELLLIITKTTPFSRMFDHCENEIIQIRIRIPYFSKGGRFVFKVFNLYQMQ